MTGSTAKQPGIMLEGTLLALTQEEGNSAAVPPSP